MKIHNQMNLHALAELMGECATIEEASYMRDRLVLACWPDTESVPDDIWQRMMDDAVLHAEGL